MALIRPAAVAGMFYPQDKSSLGRTVVDLLNTAAAPDLGFPPKAIIAPHAGYIYSGACAAQAYKTLVPDRAKISRIVLLGPCHRVPVHGLATTSADYWQSPLGPVAIDRDALDQLSHLPHVMEHDKAHQQEHSLEVHLPFLQVCFPHIKLVPFVVGNASAEDISEVLEALWGGEETRIVISTDLSHFLDYDSCNEIDARTAASIETLRFEEIDREQACGRIPMSGLLLSARKRNMQIARIGMCNSGDTAGDKSRVVGYGSWALG